MELLCCFAYFLFHIFNNVEKKQTPVTTPLAFENPFLQWFDPPENRFWMPIIVLLCTHIRRECLELLFPTFCPLSLNLSVFPQMAS